MLSFSIRIPYSKSSILPLELAHKMVSAKNRDFSLQWCLGRKKKKTIFHHSEDRNAKLNILKFQVFFREGVAIIYKSHFLLQWSSEGSDARPQLKTIKHELKISIVSNPMAFQHSTWR